MQPSSVSSFNKILFQSKAIILHFGEGPRKIKVKKHARTHTPKAAKLSTCSPQQAGVRNYSSVELSFLYRGITSKKKTTKPEITSFCSRNLDDQQQSLGTTTRKLRRCRTRTGYQRASHLRHYSTALVSQAFALSLALKDFTQTITL